MLTTVKRESIAQLEVRQRFKIAIKLVRSLMPFLKLGYRAKCKRQKKLKPHNIAVAQVFKEVIRGTYPDLVIDYSALVLSEGSVHNLYNSKILVTAGLIELTHDSSLNHKWNYYDDKVIWVLYCPTLEECISVEGKREDPSFTMTVPLRFEGLDCHHYLMVSRRDYSEFSKTRYLGKT
ncbi:hypothetical protein SAMN05660841_00131 [Sphingobacterium nematocida]|uniref:Uncharacterized protein n=1 Tax=Sphingobacterium nematocida TaxID=1513896 RepID=A0A1T5ASQ3_9SPHI|nr:DUF6266 family protein [Sphingobacterium nematocida]SKB37925.1 hypothetical protein SAMN05660841_00131 [Sphingobacterium nematocida]